jgi:hypothetical protein
MTDPIFKTLPVILLMWAFVFGFLHYTPFFINLPQTGRHPRNGTPQENLHFLRDTHLEFFQFP